MAKKRSFQLVYRHSPLLLKCAVLATVVLSAAALTVLTAGINHYQAEKEALRNQAAQLEQENKELEERIDQKDTVQGIKDIASEELGYVEADTTYYEVVTTNQD